MDRQSFARGNPFARAIRPDDEKATSPILYVVFGLLSLVMVGIFLAALFLPPLFILTLIVRGLRLHRWSLVLAGGVLGLIYFSIFFAMGKRLLSARHTPSPADDEEAN